MKHKYLLIFICLIVCLFSIASVCAGDINESAQTNGDSNDELIEIENQYSDEIYIMTNAENDIVKECVNQTILKGDENIATFNDLYNLIESTSEGSILELDKDYKNIGDYNFITINKQMTIDGKGHTIDANHLSRIFYIQSSDVTLKDINFINGDYYGNGGAILFKSNLNSTIIDSNFINCSSQFGGAVYFNSNSNTIITNSNFINCSGEFGGAVFLDTNVNSTISNSNFEYNVAEVLGGSLLAGGKGYISVIKSNFTKSFAKSESGGAITFLNTNFNAEYVEFNECISEFGGAITLLSSKSNITHSTFRKNNATYDGGAIFARGGTIYLADNLFSQNSANRGGGVHIAKTTTSILNNQFVENSASNGGAVYSITSTDKIISGNTFVNNHGSPQADYYSTNNSNLTITSDDYYQFKYIDASYTILPAFYSLVDDNYVTPVKDQGVDGNCWAFAGLAALESCILKASNLTFDLSEANLKNLMAYYSDYGYVIGTNEGGYPEMTYGYLASWLGPIWDSDDPYYTNDFLSPLLKSILHIQNIVFLKREDYTDNDDIKNAILNYGGVCTNFYYSSSYLKNSVSYYYTGTHSTNHAVCIVGWDDNYSKNNFKNTPQGDGAWIVKNSWGPSWGDAGYFYVSYYDTQFAKVNTTNSYTFILNDTIKFNRNYQLEIQMTAYQTVYDDEICYKNVFNVAGDEYLAAVSTYFAEECDYKISILINDLLVSTKLGKANAGYYTIDLNDLIHLNKNDNVTVVFNCTNIKSGTGQIPCSTKSKCTNLFLEKGVSFYWKNNKWADFYSSNAVACIKMFTTFSVEHKLNPYFQITSEGDNHDKSFLIGVILPDDATGLVSINCDNKEYIIDLSTSKSIKLYGLTEKNNTLQIKYSGDDKYLEKIISYVVDTNISQTGTFEELSNKIINFNDDELLLTKDYYHASGSTSGIDISKTIIINGQGHYIDANHLSKIFNIYAKNVILKNIKFIGSYEHAVEIYSSDCSIINCTFIDNYASGSGGAIYWSGENGILTDCSFENNTASYGGAVYWAGKFGKIDECTFINNYIHSNYDYGGAICWSGVNGTVINSIFIGNEANGWHGGAIYWSGRFGIIMDCLFTNNTAGFSGGAIYLSTLDNEVYNCTFIDNSASYGGAIYSNYNNNLISDCQFISNRGTGAAIYLRCDNSQVRNSIFIENQGSLSYVIQIYGNNHLIENVTFLNNSISSISFNGDNITIKNSNFINGAGWDPNVSLNGNNGTLVNCSFVNCQSTFSGAGALSLQGDEYLIKNCSFISNIADTNGGAIYWSGNNCDIINCNFVNNSAWNSFSNYGGGALFLLGNNVTIYNSSFINNHASKLNGGAIHLEGNWTNLSHCLFIDNYVNSDEGGAIYLYGGNALISDNEFINNTANIGGAVSLNGDMNNLFNNIFTDNSAKYGGAICLQGSNGYLDNCSFINNGASDYGGAIYITGIKSILEKCSFANNFAQYGGAILLQGDGGKLSDCSFINNSALKWGGAIYWMGVGSLYDSDFSNNFAQDFGGAIFWRGENGILINSTFDDNIANNNGSAIYWYGNNGNLINSTFINTLKVNQIYFYDETGTIVGCKFLNTTVGNVIYNGDNFIKRSIDLTCSDYSFNYNSPEIISIHINNILKDLPILTPIAIKLSKDGATKSFNISVAGNTATLYDELFNLNVGIWKVDAIFVGDDNYYSDDTSFNINIFPEYSFINLTMDTATDYGIKLTAYITDSNNRSINEGNVIFFDGETNIGQVNVNEGVASLSYAPTTAGEHIITAIFTSDNYLSSNNTLNFTIDKVIPEIVFDEIITVEYSNPTTFTTRILYDNKLVKEGVVKFYIDDVKIKSVDNDNGLITFDYVVENAGLHNFTVIFEESDNYLSATNSLNFTVDKLQTSIVILNDVTWQEISHVTYDDYYCTPKLGVYTSDVISLDGGSAVPLYERLTNYIAYFKGSTDNVIVNSDGSFYLRNLTVGTYNLFVELNDSNRKGSGSFAFTIDKGYASLSIPEITIGYGEYGNSTAITKGATVELGECEPYVMSNKDQYKDFIRVDGHVITVLPGLDAGTHFIDFIIKDDNWKSSETCKFKVNVLPADTAFASINDMSILYGTDSIIVNGKVNGIKYSNYAGNVNVVIGNVNAKGNVNSDGSFSVKVSGINTLNVGRYNAIVSGESSSKNYNSPKSTSFALTINPSDSILDDIVISDFEYGATGMVNIRYSGALGISAYVLNHDEANIKINNNVISVSNLDVGSYVLNVSTIVDGNHNSVSKVANFKVNRAGVDIQFNDIETVTYKNPSTITVTILSNNNLVKEGIVKFYINGGEIKSFNNENGTITFDYATDAGMYTVTATFDETSHYLSSSKSSTFEVKKLQTVISSANVNAVYNVAKYLTVTLKDSNGNPLSSTPISVNLNGVKSLTTDNNGQVKLSTNGLVPKAYNVAITFNGNNNYDLSKKTVKVTVKKATPKLTAKAKTFKVKDKTKKYVVTLKTNQNKVMKNTKVTLKVNGKTYAAKTNAKGQATFKLTKLTKKGKCAAVVKYVGNKYYNAKTVKPKITVK